MLSSMTAEAEQLQDQIVQVGPRLVRPAKAVPGRNAAWPNPAAGKAADRRPLLILAAGAGRHRPGPQ